MRAAAARALGTVRTYLDAIRRGDEEALLRSLEEFVRSRPWLAPFAVGLGGAAMLLAGVRLLLANWRVTLVQVLPALWIWAAMYDLRLHVVRDGSIFEARGPVLIPIGLAIVALTAASFYLNAVFAFAVGGPPPPRVRPALVQAREHLRTVLAWGVGFGLALALSTTVLARGDRFWFTLALGVVVGLMMLAYVAVPARLVGVRPTASRRDRLSASAITTALGALVTAPPYLLGRIGLLMIGSPVLRLPGIVLFAVGVTLQAGATSAVRAVKMGARLGTGGGPAPPRDSGRAPS